MNASSLLWTAGLGLAVAMGGLFATVPLAQAAPAAAENSKTTAPELHSAMRALWHGHIVNTRAYAKAVKAGDAAAASKAADATVANAKEIANAVAGFYGEDAGKGMFKLLAGHWQGVKDLTDAQHANDAAAEAKAKDELNTNADAVAKFLSSANPNLPYDAVKGLMMTHIGYHEAQIQEIMAGESKAEASTWKSMQAHMNMFADALSDGIAKQFPDKAK
ncbi:hypothetical protein [Dokdonella sp.]|uniref:hypothetical protein n=1 Tax=Dokdonella sp. TaxID=2291710 RepID=UPI0031CA18B2|nr:hypothetical protein [Dokdonella sp.]